MDIDYEKIKEKIAAISFFETGDAMLLNKNNEIVFSERFEKLRKKDNYNLEIERIKSLKKFNVDAVSESHSIKMFGENIRFSSRDLVNGMKLVIMVPEEEINKDRKLMIIQCLIIIMIGLFISILICANITNKMEKVLGKITSSVQEIAKGNYEISVDVEEKNEFGELAKSFNEAAREFDRSKPLCNIYQKHEQLKIITIKRMQFFSFFPPLNVSILTFKKQNSNKKADRLENS